MSAPPSVALSGAIVGPTEEQPARAVTFLCDQPDDVTDDGRWLTYDELAKKRGISRASARRLVQRNGWRQQHDDEQTVRILVPFDRSSPGMSDISAAFGGVLDVIRDAHAGEIRALREQLVEARSERDQQRERAEQAEAATAAERQRADDMHEQVKAAELAVEEVAQLRWQVAEAQQASASSPQREDRQEPMSRLRRILSRSRTPD